MVRLFSLVMFCLLFFSVSPGAYAQVTDSATNNSNQLENPAENEEVEYPEAYLIEAEKFRSYCKGRTSMSDYYDCDCLAVEYLKRRNEVGPFTHGTAILSDISKTCPDATGAAGTMYNQCVGKSPSLPDGVDVAAFCECFGNTYAEMFVRLGRRPSSKTSMQLHALAKAKCRSENGL